MRNTQTDDVKWQIYQIDFPGVVGARFIVAPSLERALAIGVSAGNELPTGQPMIVWNVTMGFLSATARISQQTWALLEERVEGILEGFDHEEGWVRVESR
jgi:hypothetical protein